MNFCLFVWLWLCYVWKFIFSVILMVDVLFDVKNVWLSVCLVSVCSCLVSLIVGVCV